MPKKISTGRRSPMIITPQSRKLNRIKEYLVLPGDIIARAATRLLEKLSASRYLSVRIVRYPNGMTGSYDKR